MRALSPNEQARLQAALRESQGRVQSLFEYAVFGIFEGTLDGQLLAVNPALVSMLGYESARQLLKLRIADLYLDAEVRAVSRKGIRDIAEYAGREAMWRHRTGAPVRVRLTGHLTDRMTPSGQPVIEVFVEDMTERHRLAEQLQQATKMEGLGRLAGGIAHDFNNILTTIAGYSDMVIDQIGPDKPIALDLAEIRTAVGRGVRLTQQLLAFSRRQVLNVEPVDINSVVCAMLPMLRRLMGEDITAVTHTAADLPTVMLDRGQLEQVLMNLAANARDAMPRGGRFRIVTTRATSREFTRLTGRRASKKSYVKLVVGDEGCGMDAGTRAHIFEPFFTTKASRKGTGFGLATVYGIVTQSGGHISVASEPGCGTAFTIVFPAAQTPREEPISAPVAVAPLASHHETVLVVEDERCVRQLAALTLRRHGYTVLEACNGHEGIATAAGRADRIDLVVSDLVMPALGGVEMVERIRAHAPAVRVLYLTGYPRAEPGRRGAPGARPALLQKPFSARDLLHKVREVLDAP